MIRSKTRFGGFFYLWWWWFGPVFSTLDLAALRSSVRIRTLETGLDKMFGAQWEGLSFDGALVSEFGHFDRSVGRGLALRLRRSRMHGRTRQF